MPKIYKINKRGPSHGALGTNKYKPTNMTTTKENQLNIKPKKLENKTKYKTKPNAKEHN